MMVAEGEIVPKFPISKQNNGILRTIALSVDQNELLWRIQHDLLQERGVDGR